MITLQKIKTFFLEFNNIKKLVINYVNSKTIERVLGQELTKKQHLITYTPNPEIVKLWEEYLEGKIGADLKPNPYRYDPKQGKLVLTEEQIKYLKEISK